MKQLFIIFFATALITASIPVQLQANTLDKNNPSAIRQTPPAPKFSDAERQAEFSRRRAAVLDKMEADSVLVLFSAEAKIYTNDVDFMFRQENNLYYLTGLKQQNATLVLSKSNGTTQEVLFIPKRNPQFETWNGRMYSNEDATRISGVKTIVNAAEQKDFLTALKGKSTFTSKDGATISNAFKNVYLLMPESPRDRDGMREFAVENEFSKSLGGMNVQNAQPIFANLRLVKSPYELKLMQHAIDITTEAQMRAMATSKKVSWEYETQAEIEYVFRKRNADYWGYPSIVGCGPNATTLHYEESQGGVKQGDLLLMDVGAEYDHYTADITRTFPTNGKFSKPQAEIYQIVYDAQEAAAAAIKPGASFDAPSNAAAKVIEAGLAKLGLIEKVGATYTRQFPDGKGGMREIQVPQSSIWYMHGWGHWLGMNVHDVGDYETVFKPGMIMTNEPGIYIREDALDYFDTTKPGMNEFLAKVRPAFERYKNIGVRIEDDMLVTANGTEWMSKNLPRKMSDIEDFMARASKEMATVKRNPTGNPQFAANFAPMQYATAELFDWQGIMNGKTVRQSWIQTGKAITRSVHSHN